jgi:hypothetical protein
MTFEVNLEMGKFPLIILHFIDQYAEEAALRHKFHANVCHLIGHPATHAHYRKVLKSGKQCQTNCVYRISVNTTHRSFI